MKFDVKSGPRTEARRRFERVLEAARDLGANPFGYEVNGVPSMYSRHVVLKEGNPLATMETMLKVARERGMRVDRERAEEMARIQRTALVHFWFLSETQTTGGVLLSTEQVEHGPYLAMYDGNGNITYAETIDARTDLAWEKLDRRVARAANLRYQEQKGGVARLDSDRKEYTYTP